MNLENGNKVWKNKAGKLHREDGPAIERASGSKEWWIDGELHREDGPAVDLVLYNEWYLYGKLHRKYGPAIEWGKWGNDWWLYDEHLSYPTFLALIVQHNLKLHLLTQVLPTGAETLVYKYAL